MGDNGDDSLDGMSSGELLELQARIHEAIRAHIRVKNAQLAAAARPRSSTAAPLPQVEQSRQRSLAVFARTRDRSDGVPTRAPAGTGEQPDVAEPASDLERERDAWLAKKRTTVR